MASEALADAPDEATIREMHSVLRLMELCLRNVDMPSNGDDEIVGWAPGRALSRLQSRLLVLRAQATSSTWSSSFLKVLKRARSLRVCPLTRVHAQTVAHLDDDDQFLQAADAEKEAAEDAAEEGVVHAKLSNCSACSSNRGLHVCPENAFELIGNSPLLHPKRDDDSFLLTCNPDEIHRHIVHRFDIDSRVGKVPEVPDLVTVVPQGYRGLFVTGPKCHVLASTFVWLQNFLPNVAYLLEGELCCATPEELELPASEFSVVTGAMAKELVLQLERVEMLLRGDIDRAVTSRPPPPLTNERDGGLPEHEVTLWERVHDACWRATESQVLSPRGKGVTNMRLAEKDGWTPTPPPWHSHLTGARWDLEAYILYLNRRLRSAQANFALTLDSVEMGDDEEEDEEVVMEDEVVVLEEDEEDEEDERTRRRKRRSNERAPQQSVRKTRPKRRAVVEDEEEVEEEVEEDAEEEAEEDAEEEAEGIEVVEEQSKETMLHELLCNAHEEAALDMRRAASVADAVGMREAQVVYEAKVDSARHLQRSFGLARIA